MSRNGARKKDFFVQVIDENKGTNPFETYYTNIREKKNIIKQFHKKIADLGHCEESVLLVQHCETLQIEIDILMDLFRRKIKAKSKKIVYIPMDMEHALDYLGYLINENIERNMDSIRNVMNALEFETGVNPQDKNQMSYYKKLINHFRKDIPDVR